MTNRKVELQFFFYILNDSFKVENWNIFLVQLQNKQSFLNKSKLFRG